MKNTVFPHKFWRPFLDCMPQLFFRPQYVWFPVHLKGHLIPLCFETLVVNWQNWLFTLFHQSRSVLSPNPIEYHVSYPNDSYRVTTMRPCISLLACGLFACFMQHTELNYGSIFLMSKHLSEQSWLYFHRDPRFQISQQFIPNKQQAIIWNNGDFMHPQGPRSLTYIS